MVDEMKFMKRGTLNRSRPYSGASGEDRAQKMYLYVICAVTFLLHFSISFWVRAVVLASDEFAVTAIAAYLSGENWSTVVREVPYYGYGQAVLYVPVFLVTQDPTVRYILMGVINSALLSTIPAMVYKTLELSSSVSPKRRCWYAFLVGIFPSQMVYTKWLWNETMLMVVPWVLLVILLRLVKGDGRRKFWSVLFATVAVYGYAVHGRGIVFIALALLMIFYLWAAHRKVVVHLPCFFAALGICLALDGLIKSYLMSHLWCLGDGAALGNTATSMIPSLLGIFSWTGIKSISRLGAVRLVSASLSTYGLLLVVIVYCIKYLTDRMRGGGERINHASSRETIQWLWKPSWCIRSCAIWAHLPSI